MKEKIEAKIERIIDFIIRKPESEITADDYMILANEVREIRFRENQSEEKERMDRIMGMAAAHFPAVSNIRELHPPVDCA